MVDEIQSKYEYTRRILFGLIIAMVFVASISVFVPRSVKESMDITQPAPALTGLAVVSIQEDAAPFVNVVVPFLGLLMVVFMLSVSLNWKRFE